MFNGPSIFNTGMYKLTITCIYIHLFSHFAIHPSLQPKKDGRPYIQFIKHKCTLIFPFFLENFPSPTISFQLKMETKMKT